MKEKLADKMQELIKIKGLININGMKFHNIEGGFGGNKRSMLAKEIANIHGRDLKDINRNINNNIKRFKNGIDILDLKVGELKSLSLELGYSNQSYANANNIYLLSERGYSKLLKILEDDVAWEQYEKLVDGYFNLRGQVIQYQGLSKELQAIFSIDAKQQELDGRITTLEERMTIETGKQKFLCDLVNKRVVSALGGKDTPAYRELGKKAFRQCWNDFKKIVNVASYKDTAVKDFDFAKKVIIDWKPNRELELMIKGCNAQIRM